MRHFRLIFQRDTTILERRLGDSIYYVQEICPDRVDQDAKLLDQLLNKLADGNDLVGSAFEVK